MHLNNQVAAFILTMLVQPLDLRADGHKRVRALNREIKNLSELVIHRANLKIIEIYSLCRDQKALNNKGLWS